MHGAFRRGLFGSALLGATWFALAVACTEQRAGDTATLQPLAPSSEQPALRRATRADLGSLIGKATVPFSSKGSALVPVVSGREIGTSPSLGMELPLLAGGKVLAYPAHTPERSLALTPAVPSSAQATLGVDGSAVYERAFGSADLIQSASLDGLRTQIALYDEASPDLFVWRAELGAGLRAVARDDLSTDMVDAQGSAWLRVNAATISDAQGTTVQAAVAFGSDGYARLRVDRRGLRYPALIDFDVVLGGGVRALAIAPTQIKGRVMVLLDTSGSMIYEFGSDTVTGGDSPVGEGLWCDNTSQQAASTYACNANVPCTLANGGRQYWSVADDAVPSRLLGAKLALQNVVNANSGLLDFGLERYAEAATCPNTTHPEYCCNTPIDGTTRGVCANVGNYTDPPNTGGSNDISYDGSCGSPTFGGRVLVSPGPASGPQLLPWVDFVEDFCSSTGTVGDAPRNPELRGDGSTPLARAITTARESWYRPVFTDSRDTMNVQPLDDSLIDCRPYVLVVMTDGDDTCQAGSTHSVDCSTYTGECNGSKCFDANTGNNTDMRCACSAAQACTGTDQSCNLGTVTQDCADNNAVCGSGACFDTATNGDNFRCACIASADCGTGMTCNTGSNPQVDCRNSNARCQAPTTCQNVGGGNYRCVCASDAGCPASEACVNNRCQARGICQAAGVCQVAEPLPRVQVQRLTDVNTTNPVKTYVLAMGDANGTGLDKTELGEMAISGGTDTARYASSQAEIEAAFADIVANTVKYEKCNAADDNCNNRYDEGLQVYQECLVVGDCNGGACDHGRCVCNGQAQCANGYTCSNETPMRFCRPSCSEGLGACFVSGVRKCGVGVGQCCINDTSATCNDLVPPAPQTEICNAIDDNCNGFINENLNCQGCVPLPEVCDGEDNDCDGKIDEPEDTNLPGIDGLVDVGGSCGSDVGRCTLGTAACKNGSLECDGGTGPFPEICNGFDDDCDGVVDGMTQGCYTGVPATTEDVGICHGGTQVCTAVLGSNLEKWGTCTGQQLPQTEICNGVDDNCDGPIDNGIPAPKPSEFTGDECCGDGVDLAQCGVGQCSKGMWACAGNVVVCANAGRATNEVCDNIDNDCNGVKDNIPSVGGPCVAPGGCSGKLECDSNQQMLVCTPDGSAGVEVCDGMDNDCDGKTDEIEDVSVNDPWWGDDCDLPEAGHDQPPCKPGTYVCKNGSQVCEGAVGPLPEVCDLKDTDCDGVADTLAACPGTNACVQGVCVEPCHGGEFPCPGGYDCQAFGNKKYCVPNTCNDVECPPGASCKAGKCTLDNAGGASNSGDAGAANNGEGANANAAGAGNDGEGGNGQGTGASGTGEGAGTAGSTSTAGSSTTTTDGDSRGIFGLVTGGGGCACRTTPVSGGKWAFGLALLVLGSAFSRRRTSAKRRAA